MDKEAHELKENSNMLARSDAPRVYLDWLYNRLRAVGRDQARYGFLLVAYPLVSWLLWLHTREDVLDSRGLFGFNIAFKKVRILQVMPLVLSGLAVAWAGSFYAVTATMKKLAEQYKRLGGTEELRLYDIDTEHNLIDWWDWGNPSAFPIPSLLYALLLVATWVSIVAAWFLMGPGVAICTALASRADVPSLVVDWWAITLSVYSFLFLGIAVATSYRIVFKRFHRVYLERWAKLPKEGVETRLRRWDRKKNATTSTKTDVPG